MTASGELFRATAGLLRGGRRDAVGAAADDDGFTSLVATLQASRTAEMERVRRRLDEAGSDPAGSAAAGSDADSPSGPGHRSELLDHFDVLFPVRMTSYLALSVSANALVAVGREPGDTAFEFQTTAPSVRRSWRDTRHVALSTLRTHLRPSSRWFRNAVRVGAALATSAVVADLIDVDHSFWIVLGTLSVLRSGVMDTGASAIECVAGTFVGFAVAALVMATIGDDPAALWVALPITIFAAAYLADVVNYLAGQAAFTVMVVVMFNLSEQVGWHLGLVRLERVLIGVAVSLVAAVLIWPRGVGHELARAVAQEYRAALRYSRDAFVAVLGPTPPPSDALNRSHHAALAARAIAESELGDLMNSRESTSLHSATWGRLVARPHGVLLGADWLREAARRQGQPATQSSSRPTVAAAVASIADAARAVGAPLLLGASTLDGSPGDGGRTDDVHAGGAPGPADASAAGLRDANDEADRSIVAARTSVATMLEDPSWRGELTDRQVIGLLWAVEWTMFLRDLAAEAAPSMVTAGSAVGAAWWR